MSMIACEACGHLIDSDIDVDCFVEIGNMKRLHKEVVWCEPCRESHCNDGDREGSCSHA